MSSTVPPDFVVVALIAAFNEEDIVDQVVTDLIRQGIAVYLIDDGSSDRTAAAVRHHQGRGLLEIERREPRPEFDWTSLLRRKEELAREIDAHWFLHQDADEFRESPWGDLNLREALWYVDRHGYNAVDFRVLNFRPTTEEPDSQDVRASMRFYEPADDWDAIQVKAWRKHPSVDLVTMAGHEARFDGRRIWPMPFLSRHYPVRGQSHGTRKVFAERRPRFSAAERQRGWHVQYDALTAGHNFVRDASGLIEFDPADIRVGLALEHRDLAALAAEVSVHTIELTDAFREQARGTSELERHVAEVQRRYAVCSADLAVTRKEVAAAKAALDAEYETVSRLRDTVASQADQVSHLEAGLRAAMQAERRFEQQRRFLQDQLREYSAEATRARNELQALRRSKSWRITAPLRAGYELAHRSAAVPADALPARLQPASGVWGVDRGLPIDRYYIDRFLQSHREDVRGRVLEVKDSGYARLLDDGRTHRIDVLDVDASNANATVVADLAHADDLPGSQFDCFILTQTLHIIYDIRAALGHAIRLLKPGGVLLCTIPAMSRVNYENGGLASGDYWRLTQAAVGRLCEEFLPASATEITTYGNVAVCSAFLYGLAATEIPAQDLEFSDPWFPLIHCVRAVRP